MTSPSRSGALSGLAGVISFAIALLWTTLALAQGPQVGLRPPRLIEAVEAERTPEMRQVREEVAVVLVITIAADGAVREVEVAEGAGERWDAAAAAAARQFRFEPARRDGEAIPARIRFRYVFSAQAEEPEDVAVPPGERPPPEPEEEEAPPPPPAGRMGGRVLEGEAPIEMAEILLYAGAEGEEVEADHRAVTDAEGNFSIESLPPGAYRIEVIADGYQDFRSNETVRVDELTEITFRLAPDDDEGFGDQEDPDSFGAVATVDAPSREVTRRSIPREVLTRVPGTRGDALRAVELLPGVGRPSFGPGTGGGQPPGQLLVRGAAPNDSEVFLSGVGVPLLYHFGGLTSFYNSRLIQRLDLYPGNFSVRYGRRIGGVLEVEPRDPATNGYHGVVDVNLIDASLLLEGPVGDRASIAIAARRSYADFFFQEVVPDGVFDVVAAPVYYDYQLIFSWRPTDEDRIRLLVYGSSDEFNVVFGDPDDDDPALRGAFNIGTEFHRIQAQWRHVYSDDVVHDITLSGGVTNLLFGFGPSLRFDAEFIPLALRSEWRAQVSESVRLTAGLDWTYIPTNLTFLGPPSRQSEGAPNPQDPNGVGEQTNFSTSTNAYRPALYVEADLRPAEDMQVVVGARLDFFREIQQWTFNPRMSMRWTLSPEFLVKYGVGIFSQPPAFQESAAGVGNPELGPTHALHISGGAEYRPDPQWRFEIESYYKHLWDRVVGTEGGVPPGFVNDGIGRIYGIEFGIRAEPRGRFFGYASYSLSRSERSDRGGEWRPFDYDQTHIFTVAAVGRLGDGWELGGTFRLVSGNPYTPVIGSFYNAGADIYQPIYGAINSARNPFFHRLDLRLEKTFRIEDWGRIAVYIDVQNVYNSTNRQAISYNYNYTEYREIAGIPVFPTLGIRGQI